MSNYYKGIPVVVSKHLSPGVIFLLHEEDKGCYTLYVENLGLIDELTDTIIAKLKVDYAYKCDYYTPRSEYTESIGGEHSRKFRLDD
jgi:hypothetical protein